MKTSVLMKLAQYGLSTILAFGAIACSNNESSNEVVSANMAVSKANGLANMDVTLAENQIVGSTVITTCMVDNDITKGKPVGDGYVSCKTKNKTTFKVENYKCPTTVLVGCTPTADIKTKPNYKNRHNIDQPSDGKLKKL